MTNEVRSETCADCGMVKADWKGNNGQGVEKDGRMYCCDGCANETGCTCR
jgi:hypothetical protein